VERFSDDHFEKYRDFIREKYGIAFGPEKRDIMRARIDNHLSKEGYNLSYYAYLNVLKDADEVLLRKFAASLTVHKTDFFRETHHFTFISDNWSSILASLRMKKSGELRVWSAGCSTGEEPYTIAMVLTALATSHSLRVRVLATDLSTAVLSKAQKGIYPSSAIPEIPSRYLSRFFINLPSGEIQVTPDLRNMVTFRQFNLMDAFPFQSTFDIIFCRNVMIYFDADTQATLICKFYKVASPGAYFFIGHSESLSNRGQHFHYVQPTIYRRKA